MALPSKKAAFTEFNIKAMNFYQYLGVSRYTMILQGDKFTLKPASILCQIVFVLYNANSLAKIIFLALLLLNTFGPIEFLDQIANLDYLLCGVMVGIAALVWNYPLFEISCQLWEIETKIFARIGCPAEMPVEATRKHKRTILVNFLVVFIGCVSLGMQFYSEPKGCSFTYSIIPADNEFLRVVFMLHEVIFMAHAWFCNAGTNVMATFVSTNLSMILERMEEVVTDLEEQEKRRKRSVRKLNQKLSLSPRIAMGSVKSHGTNRNSDEGEAVYLPVASQIQYETPLEPNKGRIIQVNPGKDTGFITDPTLVEESKVNFQGKAPYSFDTLMKDFQELALATRLFNDHVSYKYAGLILICYTQYICSTCMAFQVIRTQGGGIGDIWFYLQDCIISGYQNFRVFNKLAEVLPITEQLFTAIKRYESCLDARTERRARHKVETLHEISMKIGTISMHPEGVLQGMQSLIGYYLCVALW